MVTETPTEKLSRVLNNHMAWQKVVDEIRNPTGEIVPVSVHQVI